MPDKWSGTRPTLIYSLRNKLKVPKQNGSIKLLLLFQLFSFHSCNITKWVQGLKNDWLRYFLFFFVLQVTTLKAPSPHRSCWAKEHTVIVRLLFYRSFIMKLRVPESARKSVKFSLKLPFDIKWFAYIIPILNTVSLHSIYLKAIYYHFMEYINIIRKLVSDESVEEIIEELKR